jgi:hypothetical protein
MDHRYLRRKGLHFKVFDCLVNKTDISTENQLCRSARNPRRDVDDQTTMTASLPVFPTLVRDFGDIFEVATTNGFQMTHAFPVSLPGRFRWRILCPPLELVCKDPNNVLPSSSYPRIAEGILTIPFNQGSLCVTAGTNFIASVKVHTSNFFKASARIQKITQKPFDYSVAVSQSAAAASLQAVISRRYLRLSGCVGTADIAVGLSAKIRAREAWAASLLLGFPLLTLRAQAVARLDKRAITVRVLGGQFGVSGRFSEDARYPYLALAGRLRINQCNVHSSVDTRGRVRSFFGTRVNSFCTIGFSGELDHAEERYRSGLTLNFETKEGGTNSA